jgi:hypothetical protein
MRALLLALLFTATTSGCASTKDTAEEAPPPSAAPTTQRQADDKATDVEQAHNIAAVEAATAQTAADAKVIAVHDEAAASLQKQFDTADRRFNGLKEKAKKATGSQKDKASAAVAIATTRETSVMAGIAKLRTARGADWDTTKAQIDADALALDKALVSLESTLTR